MSVVINNDNNLLIMGGGGHGKVVIDVARAAGWHPHSVLDPSAIGTTCNGVLVVGGDERSEALLKEGIKNVVIALGRNDLRLKIGERLQALGFKCPAIIHPTATVSPSAMIGDGVVVMPHAVINAEAKIGRFVIVNTGAIVEHDCELGDGVHVAPRTVMGGNVKIGRLSFFGIGAVARPGITIGENVMVGAGSVVVSNIDNGVKVIGVPARQYTKTGANK